MSRVVSVVTGSSNSGRACLAKLGASPSSVGSSLSLRACFRSEERAAEFRRDEPCAASADVRVGVDAADPASLRAALEGSHTAVIVTPLDHARGFGQDAEMSIAMVRAALDAGAQRLVHVGSWTTKAPAAMPGLAGRFLATERFLAEEVGDAAQWAVLRGGYFAGNLVPLFGAALREGGDSVLRFPPVRCAPVDARDIGEAAAALCAADDEAFGAAHHGKFIECCGPHMLGFGEVAEALGAALGRELTHEPMAVEAWCEGKPPPMQELLRYMHAEQEAAVPFEQDGAFARLLGREPTSVAQWASEHARAFQ